MLIIATLLAALPPALACGPYGDVIQVIAQDPDSAWTAEALGSAILLYNTETGQRTWINSDFSAVDSLIFSENRLLAYGPHANHAAVLYSLEGEPLQTWAHPVAEVSLPLAPSSHPDTLRHHSPRPLVSEPYQRPTARIAGILVASLNIP